MGPMSYADSSARSGIGIARPLRPALDGLMILGADSARAGLAFAETHILDVVLVDLRMPGEDGHWFLRQLRASRTVRTAQVPVFAITGERHDLPDDPASGFAGYFLKPIDLDALVARLTLLPRRSR